jgi:DNA-binding GntR family transcriptional regulator
MTLVNKATLADQAYREIRARILSGQIPGGSRLMPDDLAVALAISPTPIKEALVRLEADGLVDSRLRRGAFVRRFTERIVEELCEARMMVEVMSLANAFDRGRITPGLVAELTRNVALHEAYARGETLDDLQMALSFDREFHQQLVQAADNATVAEWHMRLLCQTHTVLACRADSYLTAVHDHQALVRALADGDKDAALAALREHLRHSRENTRRSVKIYEGRVAEGA